MVGRAIFLLMMSLFYLKRNFYSVLESEDAEFLKKGNRPYYLLHGLLYKNKKIDIAVPLRTNIRDKYKDEAIPLPPNEHTNVGCFGGWHITKAVPVNGNVIYRNKTELTKYQQIAKTIADAYHEEMLHKVQELLNKKEKGVSVFGSLDIDNAVMRLSNFNKN